MMITQKTERGMAPVLLCDVCREPIRDASMGAAVFLRDEPSQPWSVHKGACHDAAEDILRDHYKGKLVVWNTLDVYLQRFIANCGCPISDEAKAKLDMLEQLP